MKNDVDEILSQFVMQWTKISIENIDLQSKRNKAIEIMKKFKTQLSAYYLQIALECLDSALPTSRLSDEILEHIDSFKNHLRQSLTKRLEVEGE